MVIQINKHDIRVGFGLYYIGKAQEKYDTDLAGLLNSLIKHPISKMVDLMWFSAEVYAELDGKELPINKGDFVEHLEKTKDFDDTKGVLAVWSEKFVETLKGNFLPQDEIEEEVVEAEKKN